MLYELYKPNNFGIIRLFVNQNNFKIIVNILKFYGYEDSDKFDIVKEKQAYIKIHDNKFYTFDFKINLHKKFTYSPNLLLRKYKMNIRKYKMNKLL